MRYTSEQMVIEALERIIEKSRLVIERNETIQTANDFLISPERMEKFDAACMLIQVIGETAKQHLPTLITCVEKIVTDIKSGMYSTLFSEA